MFYAFYDYFHSEERETIILTIGFQTNKNYVCDHRSEYHYKMRKKNPFITLSYYMNE
jgi:hypothetical protein